MLGHRGCRLGISFPEIYEMQCRAIFEALVECKNKKIKSTLPEIMIPLVSTEAEIKIIKELFEKSVDGEAYDLEKYGQYFRPAGTSAPKVTTPQASRPVPVERTADPVNSEVKVANDKPATATTTAPTPNGDSAKRAEDILKLIRSRQSQ